MIPNALSCSGCPEWMEGTCCKDFSQFCEVN
jgi:hypothetical protein